MPEPRHPTLDVQERQLRDSGPPVRHDDTDTGQTPVDQRGDRDPADVEVAAQRALLGLDGVLPVPVALPGTGVPTSRTFDETLTVLDVENVDVFRPVDLGDPSELVPAQLSDLESGCHRSHVATAARLGREEFRCPATAPLGGAREHVMTPPAERQESGD